MDVSGQLDALVALPPGKEALKLYPDVNFYLFLVLLISFLTCRRISAWALYSTHELTQVRDSVPFHSLPCFSFCNVGNAVSRLTWCPYDRGHLPVCLYGSHRRILLSQTL